MGGAEAARTIMQHDMQILGRDCTVEYEIEPADRSVGIMSPYCGDWRLVAVEGDDSKPVLEAFQKEIDAAKGEADRVQDALCEVIWENQE